MTKYTKIKQNIIKGDFMGSFPNGDFLTEIIEPNNPLILKYTIYSSKSFKQKNSFIEERGGRFFLIGKNYGSFFTIKYIKIYLFFENNTKHRIIQSITFPENFPHDVIFPFSFINNGNLYFFLKCFSHENIKVQLYKLKNKLSVNSNNEIIKEKTFEEDEILSLGFPFIWFAQKNNNELLFFTEEENIFDLIIYNFKDKKITNHKKINLVKINNPICANYVIKVLFNKYLLYTNGNLLFIIDLDKIEISSVKELDNIYFIYISNENIIWTVEKKSKNKYLNNNQRKKYKYNYLKQYLLDQKSLELIKIGERPLFNNFVKNIVPLINNKILIFIEKGKVELLSSN